MTHHARKPFTAWLGILAIWLAIVMPVMSQVVQGIERTHEPAATLCSDRPASAHDHAQMADHLNACGYCSVLAHHPPVVSVPAGGVTRMSWIAHIRAAVHSAGILPSAIFPAGRPRDPPALS
ncbi:MAG: DUF2946 domain-containing protein [Pararobbsia sp.]